MNIDVLPIGTIVALTNNESIKFMIVGFLPTNVEGEERDYVGVRYPIGVYDNRMFFFFNHSDISSVIHKGYSDEEFCVISELMKAHKKYKEGDSNE